MLSQLIQTLFHWANLKPWCLTASLSVLTLPLAWASDPGTHPGANKPILPPGFHQQSTRSGKLQLLFHEVEQLKNTRPTLALQYARMADSLANSGNRRFAKAQSAYYLAWLYHYAGGVSSFQPALTAGQICLKHLRPGDPPYWRAQANALLSAILSDEEDATAQSGQYLQQALDLSIKIGRRTDSLRVTGMIHSIQAVQPGRSALDGQQHFHQAIADYSAAGEPVAAARAYKNLALHLFNQNDYPAANQAFAKAISLFKKHHALAGWRDALVHQANFWMEKFQANDTTLLYFHTALANLNQARQLQPNLETYLQSGYVYHLYVALRHGQDPRCNAYLDSAQTFYLLALDQVSNSQDIGSIRTLADNLDVLSAFAPLPTHTIQRLDRAYLKLLALERRETEMAKKKIFVFEQAKQKSQLWNYGLATLMLLAITGFVVTFYLLKQERKHDQTKTQLLQTRLNPHFISNCINSIDALVQRGEVDTVSNYLVKFNRFCRNILEASDQLVVSLDKELETLSWYLDLEKLRLGNRLNFRLEIDPQINPKNIQIPLFLLQPFLENAIWHGLHPQKQGGNVKLRMEKISPLLIQITIDDDGVGRNASKTLQSENNREHRSWGKDITDERLSSFNGKRGVPVKLSDGPDGKGTRVEIQLFVKRFLQETPKNTLR